MSRWWWAPLCALVCVVARAEDAKLPDPPRLAFKSHYLMDYASGTVLAQDSADERVEPASLTKLMTAYVVFKALAAGELALDEQVTVSVRAWRTGGTRMFIEVGSQVGVEDLIRGMLIQSGNDASVALAERIAGTVEGFVARMNEQAAALGMQNSAFRNPTGLPARGHYSSAHDMATLARAIITEFPDYYGLYAEREFTYNGITQHNRNALLWRDQGVDGMKTGHTAAAGYCLVSSAERDGMRLIAVVLGAETAKGRNDGAQKLLSYGFTNFETHRLYAAGAELSAARVFGGSPDVAALGLAHDLYVTIPRGQYAALSASMDVTTTLVAPLESGAQVGAVSVSLGGAPLLEAPLVSLQPVVEGGTWTKLVDELSLWLE
jgi:serine-type D-Ala-D-Ala carboxypeptidase (penicillin-binding protein 5/6)